MGLPLEIEPFVDDDQYFAFCQQHPKLRIERNQEGEILIMPPAGLESGGQELEVAVQLANWAKRDGRGRAFGPSTEYILPSGAAYAPDASWVSNMQLAKLTKKEKARFPHLVPEFVVEVRSPSDRLTKVDEKMRHWMANGVQLAWFIDARNRRITIYRPEREPEELNAPKVVAGEGPVKGFRLKMADIWAGI